MGVAASRVLPYQVSLSLFFPGAAELEVALDRVRDGSALLLPVLVGDDIEAVDSTAYPGLPHYFSGLSIRDTLVRILEMPTAMRIPLAYGPADLGRVVSAANQALRSGAARLRTQEQSRLHLERLDVLLDAQWRGIKAILDSGDLVGQGGYSKVYRGLLPDHDGPVAIKCHTVSKSMAHSLRAFQNEVDLMMLLDHPNILPLLSTHVRNKGLERYLVLPYCEGGNLEQRLFEAGGGGVEVGRTRLRIATGVADGLAYLHSRRVYHRDLKPANVLLEGDLQPRICDFGVSRSVKPDDETRTTFETVSGGREEKKGAVVIFVCFFVSSLILALIDQLPFPLSPPRLFSFPFLEGQLNRDPRLRAP